MTTKNPHHGKIKSARCAKTLESLNRVLRTRWNVATSAADPGRKNEPVKLDERDKELCRHTAAFWERSTASGSRFFTARRHASALFRTKAFASATAMSRPTFFSGCLSRKPISKPAESSEASARKFGSSFLQQSRMMRFTNARSTLRGTLCFPTVKPKRTRPISLFGRTLMDTRSRPSRTAPGSAERSNFPKSSDLIIRTDLGKPRRVFCKITKSPGNCFLRPKRRLKGELMTTLGATTSEHETAALGAGTNEEAMRANTLDLGGLIGTLGSHDESLPSVNSFKKGRRHSMKRSSEPCKHEAARAP